MTESAAFSTIAQLRSELDCGNLSAVELVEVFARRIDRLGDKSRAYISLDIDNAIHRATQQNRPQNQSDLRGIPYSCKDLFNVKGQPTTAGSKVMENNIVDEDADCISRLNAAGAIYLGKNNLHEFAYGATGENLIYGTPPNPYDRNRLAGGSSSGSVAAVGYGLCAFALGTDTGGSVRAPAALCGLVGFKPTYGRISTEGVIPYSWTLDHVGTITRCATDASIVFEQLRSQPAVSGKTIKDLKDLTIGIPDAFFFEHTDGAILASVNNLIDNLKRAGCLIKPVSMPSMEYTRTVSLTVQMPEALSYHDRYLRERGDLYSEDFRAGLALGQCLLAEQYVRAKRFIETYRRDTQAIFSTVDFILTPATPTIAPSIGTVEVDIDGYREPAGNAITRFTSFFNMTGHPAITFPCGMHAKGLPVAAQLIGRHYEDEYLLGTVEKLEAEFDLKIPLPQVD